MIFSLFGKKDGRGPERRRVAPIEPASTRSDPLTGGGSSAIPRGVDPREIARLTAAKIDEIESEMIATARPAPVRAAPAQVGLAGNVYVPSGVTTAPVRPAPAVVLDVPVPTPSPVAAPRAAAPKAVAPNAARGARAEQNTSVILGEANTDGLSMEVGASTLPPAFEEAAVLYSNGQGTAAATILWQAIKDNALPNHAKQAWAMLFDLYQATGRKDDFESLAIDYSARFETSPPTWDPEIAPSDDTPRPQAAGAPAAVTLTAALDAQAVRQLEQVQRLAQRNRGVLLDVSAVRGVDAIGADLLLRVLAAFARAQRELSVAGAESLAAVVAGSIEAGRRDPSEACWLLQLELLRLLGRQQEFDDLSIDYCVTYEVSPPPWEPMPPSVRQAAPGAAAGAVARSGGSGNGFGVEGDAFAVRGDLAGRAQDALGALRSFAADRAEVVVDCRRLRRLDFVAAGELLNEVVALRTGGKYMVFRDLNHLVAALLAVMGIPDLAEIRLRRQ